MQPKQIYEASIVIPVYNARKDLGELLKSISVMKFDKPYEIIVVDDGGSEDYSCFKKEPNLKIIRSKKNRGPGAARNLGVKESRAPYIYFIDVDCRIGIGTLQKLFSSIRDSSANTGVIIGTIMPVKRENLVARADYYSTMYDLGPHEGLFQAKSLHGTNLIMKKKIISKFKFREDVITGEDTLLGISLFNSGYSIISRGDAIAFHRNKKDVLSFFIHGIRTGVGIPEIMRAHKKYGYKYLFPENMLLQVIMFFPAAFLQVIYIACQWIRRRQYIAIFYLPFFVAKVIFMRLGMLVSHIFVREHRYLKFFYSKSY